MKVLSVILIISAFNCDSNTVHGQSVGQIIGDLPLPVITDILTIVTNGVVQLLGNCSTVDDVSLLQFVLYNRLNPNNPITIQNSFEAIDASKPTIILIHGWLSSPDSESIAAIKDAYLQRYDCNLIAVNHSMYANDAYQTSYCHAPSIGGAVAQFICNMSSALNIDVSTLHVVGHSLGAHISGLAGAALKSLCGVLGRITGLDPAGPLFQDVSASQRLDKSDSSFVDVIHSNEGEFGYIGDLGHVDFYPNCGYQQNGCLVSLVIDLIRNMSLEEVACSHSRSCFYFAESINRNAFFSTSCLGCGLPACFPTVFSQTNTYMGESCRSPPPSSEYMLVTNAVKPYGRGPVGPLN